MAGLACLRVDVSFYPQPVFFFLFDFLFCFFRFTGIGHVYIGTGVQCRIVCARKLSSNLLDGECERSKVAAGNPSRVKCVVMCPLRIYEWYAVAQHTCSCRALRRSLVLPLHAGLLEALASPRCDWLVGCVWLGVGSAEWR